MKRQDGFTLIEVLTAIALVSVAMVYSMYSTNVVLSTYVTTRSFAKAHGIAVDLMEELMSVYESDPLLTAGTHTQQYDKDGRKVGAAGFYTATWTVRNDTPVTKVMEIRLNVNFIDLGGQRGVHFIYYRGT